METVGLGSERLESRSAAALPPAASHDSPLHWNDAAEMLPVLFFHFFFNFIFAARLRLGPPTGSPLSIARRSFSWCYQVPIAGLYRVFNRVSPVPDDNSDGSSMFRDSIRSPSMGNTSAPSGRTRKETWPPSLSSSWNFDWIEWAP